MCWRVIGGDGVGGSDWHRARGIPFVLQTQFSSFFYKYAVKTLQITIFCKILSTECMTQCSIGVQYQSNTCCKAVSLSGAKVKWLEQLSYCAEGSRFK